LDTGREKATSGSRLEGTAIRAPACLRRGPWDNPGGTRISAPALISRSKFAGDEDLPVVMDQGENVEADYRQTLEGVVEAFEAVEPHRVDAPLLAASSPTARSVARLSEHATESERPRGQVDVPLERAEEDVELIRELEQLAFEDDAETELRQMSGDARDRVTDVLDAQEHAVRTLNEHIRSVGDTVAVANYRFYCPVCALDDIDSPLSVTDLSAATWHCSTCRNDVPPDRAVPRHRIRDELVLDVVDQLWLEKDDARRQVYENIEDQQSDLEEREFEQAREEIRDTWNRIKDIRSKIRDLETEAVAGAGAIDDIGNLMVKYDRLRRDRLQEFQHDVEQAREEIQRQADEIIEQTRAIEDEKREEAMAEARERAHLEREEERQRDREMLAMQLSMLGQIDEDIEELTAEQRQAHMEDRLLETEGELHAFDTVNRYRDWKGSWRGRSKHEPSVDVEVE